MNELSLDEHQSMQLKGVLRLFVIDSFASAVEFFDAKGTVVAAAGGAEGFEQTLGEMTCGMLHRIEEAEPIATAGTWTIELDDTMIVVKVVENALLFVATFGAIRSTEMQKALSRLEARSRLVLSSGGGGFGDPAVPARVRK